MTSGEEAVQAAKAARAPTRRESYTLWSRRRLDPTACAQRAGVQHEQLGDYTADEIRQFSEHAAACTQLALLFTSRGP